MPLPPAMHLLSSLAALPDNAEFDVLVIGAGGAGLSAALFAAIDGQRVLLVERSEYVGGTTALSAGTTWIPGTRHAATVNPADTLAEAARYLDLAVGSHSPAAIRQAFLDNGQRAVGIVEDQTDLHFRPYPKHPDYISDLAGATLCGRALEPLPFDGRQLGALFPLIRPPIPEFTVLGGMMVDRTDISHLLALGRSMASFKHAAKLITRHGLDRLRHPRGTRLVMGNALVGRLLLSLSKRSNVSLVMNTAVEELVRAGAAITGVRLAQNGRQRSVAVRGGVVLASGGFNRHPQLRALLIPGVPAEWSPTAPVNHGEALALATRAGARFGSGGASHAFWAPVSMRRRADGSQAVFPHFVMDRAKPGMLTVNQAGQRFVNESTSYHLFGLAMQEADKTTPSVPAYMVGDAEALRKYGMGMVRPGGRGLAPFLADGYLVQADTLPALAEKLGIIAAGLAASVMQINQYAATGVDADFGRGSTAYQQNIGDATLGTPNPNLRPLAAQGPYYAIRLYPGDIGAATGLATDADARVLGSNDQAIPGLYAVGNDMHSMMGGVYTAPGITLGPALVFGYLAARHAGARARATAGAVSLEGTNA